MADHSTPNVLLSFIDLLLSALGGVALLVFVFAAMQRSGSGRMLSPPHVLVIQVDGGLKIGREVGVDISDGIDVAEIFTDTEGASSLKVHWEKNANATYQATVMYDPKRELKMTAWLRGVDPTLGDIAMLRTTDPSAFKAYLDTTNRTFNVVAYWLDKPEDLCTIRIGPDDLFQGEVVLAR